MKSLVFLILLMFGAAVVLGSVLTDKKPLEPSGEMYAAYATATINAMDVRNKQSIAEATETPRAMQVKMSQTQTVMLAQATQVQQAALIQAQQTTQALNSQATATRQTANVQATEAAQVALAKATSNSIQVAATQAAVNLALALSQANGTQTAVAVEAEKKQLEVAAKRTEIAVQQTRTAQYGEATATHIATVITQENDERNNANTREMLGNGLLIIMFTAMAVSLGYAAVYVLRTKRLGARAHTYAEQARLLRGQIEILTLEHSEHRNQAAQYAETLKQELGKIRKAQQEVGQLAANVRSAEQTLQQTLAKIEMAEEKLRRLNEPISTTEERSRTIARHYNSGNGNGNDQSTDAPKPDLPMAL